MHLPVAVRFVYPLRGVSEEKYNLLCATTIRGIYFESLDSKNSENEFHIGQEFGKNFLFSKDLFYELRKNTSKLVEAHPSLNPKYFTNFRPPYVNR